MKTYTETAEHKAARKEYVAACEKFEAIRDKYVAACEKYYEPARS